MAIGAGAALLLAGSVDTEAQAPGRRREPPRFAHTMHALMVLAIADAASLALFAVLSSRIARVSFSIAAALLAIGFVGLYRRSVWGVLINVVTSATIGVATIVELFPTRGSFRMPVAALGALQTLLALPILFAAVTRRRLPVVPPRIVETLPAVVVIITTLVTVGWSLWTLRSRSLF